MHIDIDYIILNKSFPAFREPFTHPKKYYHAGLALSLELLHITAPFISRYAKPVTDHSFSTFAKFFRKTNTSHPLIHTISR